MTKVMRANDGGTTKTNTASETQTTYNPNPITPKTATIYVNNVELSIKKTSNKTKYNTGELVIYSIDVNNSGPDTATNLIVTDTLQSGLTYVSSTLGGSYNALTRTITWNLASLDSGKHFIPSLTATVNSGTQGRTITNTAYAYNDEIKTPITSTPVNIKVNKAVLTIRKTSDKTKYNAGDSVIYNIEVKNNGPDTATNLTVTDTLPAGMTLVSCTRGGVWDSRTRTVTWKLDNLGSGAHVILTVTAKIKDQMGKTLVNRAQAKDEQMENPVSSTTSIHIKKCRLYVKVNPHIRAKVGKTFTITYKVGNRGPDEANKVVMNFIIPEGLRFVGAITNNGARTSYNASNKQLTWILGDVKVGDPILKLNVKAVKAGTFLISSTLISSTTTNRQVIMTLVTAKTPKKVHPHKKKVKPNKKTVHHHKIYHHKTVHKHPVPVNKTGTPVGALILGVFMVLAGIILPKMKN